MFVYRRLLGSLLDGHFPVTNRNRVRPMRWLPREPFDVFASPGFAGPDRFRPDGRVISVERRVLRLPADGGRAEGDRG